MRNLILYPLRKADDLLWRLIFGEPDYMQLRPPFKHRIKISLRFPFSLLNNESLSSNPIFIVGCPRSGTTILFTIFRKSSELLSLKQESHWIWEYYHPPSQREDYSQVLEAHDITEKSKNYIRACYRAAFGGNRWVDKNPTNSLRVPAIKEIFPDAKIVRIFRNGPDTINSLINTWRNSEKFIGFKVPKNLEIEGYNRQKWVHLLPPGWRKYTNSSLEKVCAFQWISTNEALVEAKESIAAKDWVDIKYENLVLEPEKSIQKIFGQLQLDYNTDVEEFVSTLDRHVTNTESKPAIGKWRNQNPERVRRILGMIEPTMEKLGYDMGAE